MAVITKPTAWRRSADIDEGRRRRWDVVGLRTTASFWNVPKKYGTHGELFFFLIKKESTIYEKVVVSERDIDQCSPPEPRLL